MLCRLSVPSSKSCSSFCWPDAILFCVSFYEISRLGRKCRSRSNGWKALSRAQRWTLISRKKNLSEQFLQYILAKTGNICSTTTSSSSRRLAKRGISQGNKSQRYREFLVRATTLERIASVIATLITSCDFLRTLST